MEYLENSVEEKKSDPKMHTQAHTANGPVMFLTV